MFAALLAIFGLPILFASSSGSVTVQSYICQPPTKPVITTPANRAILRPGVVTFSGTATASSQVILSLDGRPSVQTAADQFNHFSEQLTLTTGNHRIGIESDSPCGNQVGDDIRLTVIGPSGGKGGNAGGSPVLPSPLPQNPAAGGGSSGQQQPSSSTLLLTIDTPREGSRYSAASVYVRGTVAHPATVQVSVNGKVVGQVLEPSTSFGWSVPLSLGQNTITVEATSGNNYATATVHVIRLTTGNKSATTSHTITNWWHTLPGKITLTCAALLVLGLILWFLLLF